MGASLVITHIFSPFTVLVLNEMVLVLVIESFFAIEHEITNKKLELRRNASGILGNEKGLSANG